MKFYFVMIFLLITGVSLQSFLHGEQGCNFHIECINELEKTFFIRYKEILVSEILSKLDEIQSELEVKFIRKVDAVEHLMAIKFDKQVDQIRNALEQEYSKKAFEFEKKLENKMNEFTKKRILNESFVEEKLNKRIDQTKENFEELLNNKISFGELSKRDNEINKISQDLKELDSKFDTKITQNNISVEEKLNKRIDQIKENFEELSNKNLLQITAESSKSDKEINKVSVYLNELESKYDTKLIQIQDLFGEKLNKRIDNLKEVFEELSNNKIKELQLTEEFSKIHNEIKKLTEDFQSFKAYPQKIIIPISDDLDLSFSENEYSETFFKQNSKSKSKLTVSVSSDTQILPLSAEEQKQTKSIGQSTDTNEGNKLQVS
jgi:hypothetical protein